MNGRADQRWNGHQNSTRTAGGGRIYGNGFCTRVEFLPVLKHPYYGSWGYQTSGNFAPTGRFGTPQDLMFLIDTLE